MTTTLPYLSAVDLKYVYGNNAPASVQYGQEYWRLYGALNTSPTLPSTDSGFIAASEQSFRAVVIGPDSDIAQVRLTYLNGVPLSLIGVAGHGGTPDIRAFNVEFATVSVEKPQIGRVDALGGETYPKDGVPAHLIFSLLDNLPLIPPSVSTTNGGAPFGEGVDFLPVILDVYAFLNEEPQFVPPRTDRYYYLEGFPITAGTGAPRWYVAPFYGRKSGSIAIKWKASGTGSPPVSPLFVEIYGLNYTNEIASPIFVAPSHDQVLIGTIACPAAPASPGGFTGVLDFNGQFDAIGIRYTTIPSGSVRTHAVFSDSLRSV